MSHQITVDNNYTHFLSDSELAYYYDIPCLDDPSRALYFTLNHEEQAAIDEIKNFKSKLHFVLMLGYFKAKLIFFDLAHLQLVRL
jgi:hypothetical protein